MDSNVVTLQLGNDYSFLPDAEAPLSRCGKRKNHRFDLYCNVVGGDADRIRAVTFHLHPTFVPRSFRKPAPPYSTVQTCNGAFTAQVEVEFYGKASRMLTWKLALAEGSFLSEVRGRGRVGVRGRLGFRVWVGIGLGLGLGLGLG